MSVGGAVLPVSALGQGLPGLTGTNGVDGLDAGEYDSELRYEIEAAVDRVDYLCDAQLLFRSSFGNTRYITSCQAKAAQGPSSTRRTGCARSSDSSALPFSASCRRLVRIISIERRLA